MPGWAWCPRGARRSSAPSRAGSMTRAQGSGWRSRERSSKPTSSASGSRTRLAAGPGSASLCPRRRRYLRSHGLPRVLIIDDDRDLLNVCSVGLEAFGHEVLTAGNGNDGLNAAAVRAPDVIVLDLGLPDLDGMELCRRIRTWSAVSVVVLSADGSVDRKVEALGDGADDYMTKPFGMRELNARIQVALRHGASAGEEMSEIDVGPLHLDLAHCEAHLDGCPLDLTPREFNFLAYLARNAGKVCTRRMI